MYTARFREILLEEARQGGFPLAGTVDVEPARSVLAKGTAAYDQWLAEGHAGAMEYLVRGRDRRADPDMVFPGVKSFLCVALPYSAIPAGETDAAKGVRYARYIRGEDYHKRIDRMLKAVMEAVRARLADEGDESAAALSWKICVDTSAVQERLWAALAGLGWIGRNTMLIHPQYGSYLLLGEVLINRETGSSPELLPNYCGSCSRCLDACPTKAIAPGPKVITEKCISYWTLEKRGEMPVAHELKRRFGNWVAGCDICQEVCPFNTKAARRAAAGEAAQPGDDATRVASWDELSAETDDQYRERVSRSSLKRVKPEQFVRNLRIAHRNAVESAKKSGDARSGEHLERLGRSVRLSETHAEDPDGDLLGRRE